MKAIYFIIFISMIVLAQENIDQNNQDNGKIYRLEKIVTQASMSELPLEEQSKSISIISEKQILQNVSTGGIQSLLEEVPGLAYSRSGGINGQMSVRGMNSNDSRSVVLLDGVRIKGRNTLEFNTFDPNSIENIEVIRGPASSLWGSDAMNGIINLRSRRFYGDIHTPFSLMPKIRALDFASVNSYVGGRAEIVGGGDGWDILIGGNAKGGKDYLTPIGIAKNSSFQTYGGDFNIGYTNSKSMRFYAQGRYENVISRRAGGLGAAPGYPYTNIREDPLTEYYLRIGLEGYDFSFADKLESYLYVRKYDTDIYNDITGTLQPVINSYILGGRFIADKKMGSHSVAYGIDFYTELGPQVKVYKPQKAIPKNVIKTLYRPSTFTDIGIFVKDDWIVMESWIFSASVRGDYVLTTISKEPHFSTEVPQISKILDENGFINDGALTGALGSVYFFNEFFSNAINLSHNFRVSGAGSRMNSSVAGNLALETIPNPALKPEYSDTAEISFRAHSLNHWVSLTGYFTYYTDLITTTTTQLGTPNRYENIGKVYIAGAELGGRHMFLDNHLQFSYSLTYTYGQDVTHNRPYKYIAPLYGRISLEYNASNWFFKIVERAYLGKSKSRIDPAQERPTKSYAMSDIYIGWDLERFSESFKDMQVIIGVENLFNAVGRNPVTIENLKYPNDLVGNPLVEPGRNFILKYAYKY
ncbi:TonB-dependent receptor [Helicobacter sp. 12S02232-10]|uniref:TonB-dependent receptor n=1 Tax=Helicobacter sp. 12S02232-10 TaxID=1476197 RepID=UPI0021518027|nr:TonB-dependent receptor [Helicobacter sp. 12S02232-10]